MTLRTVLVPGSFDPFTVGHLDIVQRACALADHVVVAVGTNRTKRPMFTLAQRRAMIEAATRHLPQVSVIPMEGTLIDAYREAGAGAVIKGLRDAHDLTWEQTQAAVNRELGGVETVYLPTQSQYAHISSTMVRELLSWGMDISRYVPQGVKAFIGDNE
ncbi:pantetheine-phosphate adenylyltransferase [Schaalia suimastitidis]|uniref:pantetheine-phosphate adenylyltransferase n=1 Tax=Schaalia suimastitidis TaxID=121163 RepID=UPI0003F64D82|nr:pantetheine-phosphate adenylyltransferase [Schaalia suimastitidis]